jgi:signal transduction histidine kinase
VYKTSHDIRGPLATLKGICNIALMDVKDREAIVFLKKLDNTSTLLNQVLDKFSRVNEIYNAYVVPKPVDIRKLLEDILHTQNKTERLKPIDVQTEIATLEGFESEPRLLYYVLNSIIDNAFRYYNESSSIASYVKVKVEQAKDEVMIRIIDNGVGIPINIDSDSLFHMFTRGSERSLTGGMGLFIATIATRKLQGEIEFHRSDDFLLTEFVLTLPLKMDLARIEKPRERGSQSASPLGIAVNHSTVNQ